MCPIIEIVLELNTTKQYIQLSTIVSNITVSSSTLCLVTHCFELRIVSSYSLFRVMYYVVFSLKSSCLPYLSCVMHYGICYVFRNLLECASSCFAKGCKSALFKVSNMQCTHVFGQVTFTTGTKLETKDQADEPTSQLLAFIPFKYVSSIEVFQHC